MRTALLILCITRFTIAANDEGLSRRQVPFERGFKAPPAISVLYDLSYSGIGSKQPHAVIGCIWPDGRAVWSDDRTNGGPPYFTGLIGRSVSRSSSHRLTRGVFFPARFGLALPSTPRTTTSTSSTGSAVWFSVPPATTPRSRAARHPTASPRFQTHLPLCASSSSVFYRSRGSSYRHFITNCEASHERSA
jgi:hypothetical protein